MGSIGTFGKVGVEMGDGYFEVQETHRTCLQTPATELLKRTQRIGVSTPYVCSL